MRINNLLSSAIASRLEVSELILAMKLFWQLTASGLGRNIMLKPPYTFFEAALLIDPRNSSNYHFIKMFWE